jgi:hypothetical protein
MSALSLLEILFSLDENSRALFVDQSSVSQPFKQIDSEQTGLRTFMKSRFIFADNSRVSLKVPSRKPDNFFQFFFLFEYLILLFDHSEPVVIEKAIFVFQAIYQNEGSKNMSK